MAKATIFFNKQDLGWSCVDSSIKEYCHGKDVCRCKILFSDFETSDHSYKVYVIPHVHACM